MGPRCAALHGADAVADKRYVELAEGTHTIMMERNRLKLLEAVQAFLEEPGRS